ncbi:MAG: cytochrome c peroxidase [Glaciecola sp.]
MPEFDILPFIGNSGITNVVNYPDSIDIFNTRSPSLRDLFGPNGELNGPLMHDGSFDNMLDVTEHYDNIPSVIEGNILIDTFIFDGAGGQGAENDLNITQRQSLLAFLKTLTGENVYTDPRWSNPFDENENLVLSNILDPEITNIDEFNIQLGPNPFADHNQISSDQTYNVELNIYDTDGPLVLKRVLRLDCSPSIVLLPELIPALYFIEFKSGNLSDVHRVVEI